MTYNFERRVLMKRELYQDKYNSDKVWQVNYLEGGYYLKQFIKGEQFGKGLRTTKKYLNELGIFEMNLIDESVLEMQKRKRNSNHGLFHVGSDAIKIDGWRGTWYVIDEKEVNGEMLYLLEHEQYGDETESLIINQDKDVILDDVWNGFYDLEEQLDQGQELY